jgi:hypothetical protein
MAQQARVEVREVAVRISIRREPLIHLEDVYVRPRQILNGEILEASPTASCRR